MLHHEGNLDVGLPVVWFVPVRLGVTVVGSVTSTSLEQSLAKLTSSAVVQSFALRMKVVVYCRRPCECTTAEMSTLAALHLSSDGT